MSSISFCVGVDLGNDKHAVCVLDPLRRVVKSCIVENDLRLLDVIATAIGDASPASVHIGLEDRNNVVVDALLAGGFAVFTANPKQVDRFRDRETVAGAKDDRRDASVLANALATDEALFQRVAVLSEAEVAMRSLTATLVELDDDHRRVSNRLRAVVLRFFPALLALCEGADQAWVWALLLRLVRSFRVGIEVSLDRRESRDRRRLACALPPRVEVEHRWEGRASAVAGGKAEQARFAYSRGRGDGTVGGAEIEAYPLNVVGVRLSLHSPIV